MNQSITAAVVLRWFSVVCCLMLVLMSFIIFLLTFPSSILWARVISRHVGLLAKCSLWSFRVMKASCFAVHSVLSYILSSVAMACLAGVFVCFPVGCSNTV